MPSKFTKTTTHPSPPMSNMGRGASSAKTSPHESVLKVLYFMNIEPNN